MTDNIILRVLLHDNKQTINSKVVLNKTDSTIGTTFIKEDVGQYKLSFNLNNNNMKVLVEGHTYEVPNFEKPEEAGQVIQFINKAPKEPGSTELVTVCDGTTNEALIEVLLNRLNYLNAKFPCRENSVAITKLDEALLWLNKRTADRLKRGVEGSHIK